MGLASADDGIRKSFLCHANPGAKPDLGQVFELLRDDRIVPDPLLPQTGVPLEWERRLSAIFVRSPEYGTRASTVFIQHRSGAAWLHERQFDAQGQVSSESAWRLR